jgi:membrane-associated phospholipid phosphatase
MAKISEITLGDFRRYIFLAFVGVFLASVFVYGIPVDRIAVLLWILGALLVSSIGRSRHDVQQLVRDWMILVLIYMAYDYSRGTADQWGIPVNFTLPRDIDRIIMFGNDPVIEMQKRFYTSNDVKWYDVVGSITYMTHFVFPVLPLVWLRVRNRPDWLRYVRRFSLTLGISVFTFIAFPAAPPWMAAEKGYMDPVSRITGRGWWELNLKTVSRTLDRGAAVLNAVAAMPSLHAGMALFVTLWFTRNSRPFIKGIALIFPVVMAVTLVYFGEHYLIDCIAGWAVVAIAWKIADKWEARTVTDGAVQLSN